MTVKEQIKKAIDTLPDDATYEDAIERLILLAEVEIGLAEAYAGQTVSDAAVRQQMERWLK